ncbi:hypothetical protein HMPREF0497_0054 [Lentilactobacillus buchneri ATCC 11577]|nr:hypothetical protein HMPREF0497_0054 [Lentilactobacillus buchneri ATCC 11577]
MRMHDFLMSKWAWLIPMFIGGFAIVYNDRLAFDFLISLEEYSIYSH